MVTTTTRPPRDASARRATTVTGPRPQLVPASRRRPALLAGSLLLLATCAAVFASAYLKAGHQVAVLAVARPVAQGATLSSGDLTIVRIAASGRLSPIAAARAGQVVGRRTSVPLVAGTILTQAELSDAVDVPSGKAVVGVGAKTSQLPAEGVRAGEYVDVVLTGAPGSPVLAAGVASAAAPGGISGAASPLSMLSGVVLVPDALVTASVAGTTAGGATTSVSLLVPYAAAPVVASASAAGQLALVAVPPPAP